MEKYIEESMGNEEGREVYHSDVDLSKIEMDEKFWKELDNRHA